MSIFIVGGAGFIGRCLIPKLVERGERVVCMDINTDLASARFEHLGDKVQMVREFLPDATSALNRRRGGVSAPGTT